MLKSQSFEDSFDPKFTKKLRIAIVKTGYHIALNNNLEKHCIETLVACGVPRSQINVFSVPGSWEVPLAAQAVAKSKKFDAIVTFGVIIKGETLHFELIANEVSRALMQLSLDYSIPIALEILAVYSLEQAEARAGDNTNNKGIEGALAVLKSLQVLQKIT